MSNKIVTILLAVALTSVSYAGVVGNWESMPTSGDGWIDWTAGNSGAGVKIETLPNLYSANTSWHTLGSQSLQLTNNGWRQSLSIKLEYLGLNSEFLNHTQLEFDVAVPNLGGAGGWGKIENVSLNASGFSWAALPNSTFMIGLWAGSGTVVQHEVIDYSAAKALVTATATSGYIELCFTTNNDSVNNEMLFDNIKFTPEPATMALLGLGGLALIRRKR
ncbi:MAG: PEP-CTERM sorting domain-containing protein [Sedimentisphaerales bacterium]|jgi:hypothetical protein